MHLKEILNSYDNLENKNFDESGINDSLRALYPEDGSPVDSKLRAESMAFGFVEDYKNEKTGWGTYFGPMMVWSNGDGTATESPSISLVTPEMIDYWERRAKEAINPILKARYSGLVWDFKNKISGINPSHEIAKFYINALVDTANGGFGKYDTRVFVKLKRALELSLSLGDKELIAKAKNAIIDFEDKKSIDDKPGLWGYAFDLLLSNKKVELTELEENKIIKELEDKLKRVTSEDSEGKKVDPWAAEAAAERLAVFYRKQKRNEDVERVILEVGKAYDKIIGDASAMQASGWLDHLHKLYIKFNLKEEAEEILLRIR